MCVDREGDPARAMSSAGVCSLHCSSLPHAAALTEPMLAVASPGVHRPTRHEWTTSVGVLRSCWCCRIHASQADWCRDGREKHEKQVPPHGAAGATRDLTQGHPAMQEHHRTHAVVNIRPPPLASSSTPCCLCSRTPQRGNATSADGAKLRRAGQAWTGERGNSIPEVGSCKGAAAEDSKRACSHSHAPCRRCCTPAVAGRLHAHLRVLLLTAVTEIHTRTSRVLLSRYCRLLPRRNSSSACVSARLRAGSQVISHSG